MIGVDWGTTSFRAHLLASDGQVLDTRDAADGILNIDNRHFGDVLRQHINRWLTQQPLPVVMSGMITSRNGWQETPYINAPAGITDVAARLVRLEHPELPPIYLITGMSCQANAGYSDVLRGEESEIFGHIASSGDASGQYLLPGTHSKWVTVREGRIDTFATCMTGDVYAALRHHTILGKTMRDSHFQPAAFERGVKMAGRNGNLLAQLFSARTLALFNELDTDHGADYLSGLLIGHEVHHQSTVNQRQSVTIVGRDALSERYAIALSIYGCTAQKTTTGLVARGHFEMAQRAGLIQ